MPSPPNMVNSIMMIFVKLLQCEKKLPEELPTPVVGTLNIYLSNVHALYIVLNVALCSTSKYRP